MLIISLAWTNVVSYVYDFNTFALELCDPIDGETEKEDTKEETEKDEKIPIDSYASKYPSSFISSMTLHSKTFQSYHHLEIYTPPPEYIF